MHWFIEFARICFGGIHFEIVDSLYQRTIQKFQKNNPRNIGFCSDNISRINRKFVRNNSLENQQSIVFDYMTLKCVCHISMIIKLNNQNSKDENYLT